MSLIDDIAEKQIVAALARGEFEDLPGKGVPLKLDDDSHVPAELRAGYRLLKNAGFLPPEMEMRREAIELNTLLREIEPNDETYASHRARLRMLELRLIQAGMSTDFLRGDYAKSIQHQFGSRMT